MASTRQELPPLSESQRAAYSDDLVKNTAILYERAPDLTFTVR